MKKIQYTGQSLFEVIFAVAIAALVLLAIVSLSSRSITTSDYSKNNALATKYALEATEWLRQERDTSWSSFYARNGSTYDIGGSSPGWGNANPITGTIFSRTVNLSSDTDGSGAIVAIVTVTWTDSQGTHTVTNTTKFTNWNI
jgi:type II secretory pathway pseudopilin PulG